MDREVMGWEDHSAVELGVWGRGGQIVLHPQASMFSFDPVP